MNEQVPRTTFFGACPHDCPDTCAMVYEVADGKLVDVTVNEKTYCTSGSSTAWLLTHGPTGGVDPESFVHCKYIVIWACNSISTNLHHWPFVLEAQKRGAKVVVIDSYKSRTAKAGDWHI